MFEVRNFERTGVQTTKAHLIGPDPNFGISFKLIDKPTHKIEVYANVNNAFDKDPPFIGSGINEGAVISATAGTNGATEINPYLYDAVGRAFTVGVRFQF